MREGWSAEEVSLIVSDYFDMLVKELAGRNYIKTAHRRRIEKLLNDRSEGSIEFKHQNISAILIELGFPYIVGYKPRGNYQQLLKDEVENYLRVNRELDEVAENFIKKEVILPQLDAFVNDQIEVDVPKFDFKVKESTVGYSGKTRVNFYKKELRNKKLGLLGEEFVIYYEKQKLTKLGQESLSKKVEHVSQTIGDSVGFDILSFDERGNEKFIEVKTTQMGKEAPFYFSHNQLRLSNKEKERFSLYRVFNFRKKPKFYQLKGSLDDSCFKYPTEFLGWPK